MPKPIELHRVATASAFSLISKIVGVAIVYATNLLLARYYGSELMGTFLIAFNLVLILSLACTFGLDYGMLRFSSFLREQGQTRSLRRLVWQSSCKLIIVSSVVASAVYFSRIWVSEYFNAPRLSEMFLFFMLALPCLTLTSILRETLRGMGGVVWATFIQNLVQPGALFAFIIVCFFVLEPKNWGPGLAWSFFASVFLSFVILLLKLRLSGPQWRQGDKDSFTWGSLWQYSYPMFLSTLVAMLWGMGDSLILALFRPPQEVAYYGMAYKVAAFVSWPLFAINSVVPPLFVKLYHQQEMQRLEELAGTAARWTYYLALPMCLLFLMFSSDLMAFFGPGFESARWALIGLALSQLICLSSGTPFYLLYMTGHQKEALKVQASAVVLIIPFMLYFSYRFGVNGIALTSGVSWALVHILGVFMVWKVMHIKVYVRKVTKLTIQSVIIFLLSCMIYLKLGLIYATIVFLSAYIFIFWYDAQAKGEFDFLTQLR